MAIHNRSHHNHALMSLNRCRKDHPTQKPAEIIERLVRALSYPGAIVLDFFAGSGTVGRVCISEGRHCLMCDSDSSTKEYFDAHLNLMHDLGQTFDYEFASGVEDFFTKIDWKVDDEGKATI